MQMFGALLITHANGGPGPPPGPARTRADVRPGGGEWRRSERAGWVGEETGAQR